MLNKIISFIFRVEGGSADEGRLDLYDASETMNGLARTLNVVTHAMANDGEIREHAHRATGVKTFIHSSEKGCFEEKIDIDFDKSSVDAIGSSVISKAFFDLLEGTLSVAVGESYDPKTYTLKKLLIENSTILEEIADSIDEAIKKLHRTIKSNPDIKIYFERPRVGDFFELNKETLDFVTTTDETIEQEEITGNITRFNSISDFGRLYSDEVGFIVSFRIAEKNNKRVRLLAVKSMKEMIEGNDGKLKLRVTKILNTKGMVKKYIVHDIYDWSVDE